MIEKNLHHFFAEERDGFRFRSGHNVTDLAATLQARLTPTPRELLKTAVDLARWLVAAGLAQTLPNTTDRDLALARALREAINNLASAQLLDSSDPSARAFINDVAASPAAAPRLSPEGAIELTGSATALLATLAREAILLFGGELADRIRQCRSPTCTLFFIDPWGSGDRRWCSMSDCGVKTKVAKFCNREVFVEDEK